MSAVEKPKLTIWTGDDDQIGITVGNDILFMDWGDDWKDEIVTLARGVAAKVAKALGAEVEFRDDDLRELEEED